jgi:hypothetical protein
MSKIISKLLSVQFPTVDSESLMEIINATSNPELATEILCGLYEQPIIPVMTRKHNRHNNAVLTLTKYDKWNDKVHYSYMREKTKSIRIADDTDKSLITLENYKEFEVSSSYRYHDIPLGEKVLTDDYATVSNWLSYDSVTMEDLENEAKQNAFESEHC